MIVHITGRRTSSGTEPATEQAIEPVLPCSGISPVQYRVFVPVFYEDKVLRKITFYKKLIHVSSFS